tara:strand:- start:107 stop:1336 length:1230 start_codon:yes stop_codon:yes gene_type:complete
MQKFSSYLAEEKNVHMEHIEDSILNGGVNGARQAINYLRSLRDMLAGNAARSVKVTVKWDGAPAIFAGKDPSDDKFFVAKKGVFNKNPKVYKTDADIDADTDGDLNTKLKEALKYLPALGIEGVVQGDFLYSKKDIKTVEIDGESYITFHPNTIVYAIPAKSELAKTILASNIGVVWHTVYRGATFETMSASFGEAIASDLTKSRKVWAVDASYKDASGTATFNKRETTKITKILSDAGKSFQKIKPETMNNVSNNPEFLIRMKGFINVKVKAGEKIKDPNSFVTQMVDWMYDYYQKEIDKLKTERGKKGKEAKRKEVMAYFSNTPKSQIVEMFKMYNLLVDAKHMIIAKLDKAKTIGTFLQTADGYRVTPQEGFVAIDRFGKNAVKLVDRMQFSQANFSPEFIKGWQK